MKDQDMYYITLTFFYGLATGFFVTAGFQLEALPRGCGVACGEVSCTPLPAGLGGLLLTGSFPMNPPVGRLPTSSLGAADKGTTVGVAEENEPDRVPLVASYSIA